MVLLLLAFSLAGPTASAAPENRKLDSLHTALATAAHDSTRIDVLMEISTYWTDLNYDKASEYALQALTLADKLEDLPRQASVSIRLAWLFYCQSNFALAYEFTQQAELYYRKLKDEAGIAFALRRYGDVYKGLGDYVESVRYFDRALAHTRLHNPQNKVFEAGTMNNQALVFLLMNQAQRAVRQLEIADSLHPGSRNTMESLGRAYIASGQFAQGLVYIGKALDVARRVGDSNTVAFCYLQFATVSEKQADYLKAIRYASRAEQLALAVEDKVQAKWANEMLARCYATLGNYAQVYRYQLRALAYADSMRADETRQRLVNLRWANEIQKKKSAVEMLEKETERKQLQLWGLMAGLVLLLVAAFFQYRAYRQKEQVNQQLAQKEEETAAANRELQALLQQLRITQDKLIQQEKMAALGQLIAGIAHEINTPISAIKATASQVLQELPQMIRKLPELLRSITDAEMELLLRMIQRGMTGKPPLTTRDERQMKYEQEDRLTLLAVQNPEEKAALLVKMNFLEDPTPYVSLLRHPMAAELLAQVGMLVRVLLNNQGMLRAADKTDRIVATLKGFSHRELSGEKMPTYITGSIDGVLALYENQFRHKVSVVCRYNYTGSVPVWADAMDQVWSNLVHNALLALQGEGTIEIEVSKPAGLQVVRVCFTDNGPGIAAEIIDKIFDPFFTTREHGQGTGLGLHLSRQIVEKHGGTLYAESRPGCTVFTVTLPLGSKETYPAHTPEQIGVM